MPVTVNLRLLDEEDESLQMEGDLPVEDYGTDLVDVLMQFAEPLHYALTVDKQPEGILVQGTVSAKLACQCARCLKRFTLPIEIDDFAALVPLTGEGALTREGDFGDLTPFLREDIYLRLPANPLCKPECRGMARKASTRDSRLEVTTGESPTPWAALDQLKL